MLLPLASGQFQPHGIPGHECTRSGFPPVRNGRRFPPIQSNHGFTHAANGPPIPPTPLHHRLRQRRMDWDMIPTTAPPPTVSSTPRIDCGESPLVRQTGCPCFNLETITSQMDLKSAAYCDLYQSKPVDENDPCKHLYPPAYAGFYASAPYTGTEDFGMSFGYNAHYDPDEEGGNCHGSIYDYIFKDNNGDYEGESHSYFLEFELTQMEFEECNKVIEDLMTVLANNPNCLVEIGSGYYY